MALLHTLSGGGKDLAFQVVCLEGPLGAMSGEHDPQEEPTAPAWLQPQEVYSRSLKTTCPRTASIFKGG